MNFDEALEHIRTTGKPGSYRSFLNGIKKKFGITIRRRKRPTVIISQPRKRRYTINVGRRRPHIKSISYSDRSVFSSGTGMKPKYMRKAMVQHREDDKYKGAFMLQDNDRVMLGRYPN